MTIPSTADASICRYTTRHPACMPMYTAEDECGAVAGPRPHVALTSDQACQLIPPVQQHAGIGERPGILEAPATRSTHDHRAVDLAAPQTALALLGTVEPGQVEAVGDLPRLAREEGEGPAQLRHVQRQPRVTTVVLLAVPGTGTSSSTMHTVH